MTLPPAQVEQFYKVWLSLLAYANDQLKVVSNLSGNGPKGSIDHGNAIKVRDELWKSAKVLDQFIAENPARLDQADLQLLESWKYHRQGTFMIYKVFKKYAIFISQEETAEVYAVKGLASPFEEIFGSFIPIMVETVLLPFNDEIIADGLYQSYNVSFGPGIRADLKGIYDDAKERGAIITTLLPNPMLDSRENQRTQAEATNAKVLDAFLRYQYRSGLSPKTAERDQTNVTILAQYLLNQPTGPVSLRSFGQEAVMNYLQPLTDKERKPASLSLRRFISFLQDTGRLDWEEAESMLQDLKS